MRGDQGKLSEIVELKKKYNFRLLVDDAHGIGTLGAKGGGAGQEQGVQDQIDVYFGTFAKSFALIGGFISSDEQVVEYLRYNMRSQIFAKALPLPLVKGALKRLELMRNHPELKENLWKITNALQTGLKNAGFEIGEVTCPTKYFEEASSINFKRSVEYGIGVLGVSIKYRLAKWKIYTSKIFK
jgi:glycine C-acetyltransferase